MLQPKTPTELLIFCRQNLRLLLPGEFGPVHPSNDVVGTTTGNTDKRHERDNSISSLGVDDTEAVTDVAKAVLSWGAPFRSIETGWRVAPAAGAFCVVSRAPPCCPVPWVDSVVLCSSAKGVLKNGKGKMTLSPLLAAGTLGEPFAADFSVEDIRWLKDQWK